MWTYVSVLWLFCILTSKNSLSCGVFSQTVWTHLFLCFILTRKKQKTEHAALPCITTFITPFEWPGGYAYVHVVALSGDYERRQERQQKVCPTPPYPSRNNDISYGIESRRLVLGLLVVQQKQRVSQKRDAKFVCRLISSFVSDLEL